MLFTNSFLHTYSITLPSLSPLFFPSPPPFLFVLFLHLRYLLSPSPSSTFHSPSSTSFSFFHLFLLIPPPLLPYSPPFFPLSPPGLHHSSRCDIHGAFQSNDPRSQSVPRLDGFGWQRLLLVLERGQDVVRPEAAQIRGKIARRSRHAMFLVQSRRSVE